MSVGRSLLREEPLRAQRAVHLVGGNVLEAEVRFGAWCLVLGAWCRGGCVGKSAPVGEGGLEERRGADDVRADELAGAVDGAVHVRLRRQVEDRVRTEVRERLVHRRLVAYVSLQERIPRGIGNLLQRLQVASIGELVHHEHGRFRVAHQMPRERRADEPGPARHDAAFSERLCHFILLLVVDGRSLHEQRASHFLKRSAPVGYAAEYLMSSKFGAISLICQGELYQKKESGASRTPLWRCAKRAHVYQRVSPRSRRP